MSEVDKTEARYVLVGTRVAGEVQDVLVVVHVFSVTAGRKRCLFVVSRSRRGKVQIWIRCMSMMGIILRGEYPKQRAPA